MDWHDLPLLFQSRSRLLSLDSALLLTRGNPIGIGAFLAHLHPAFGSVTAVCNDPQSKTKLIGQMNYTLGDRSARLSFLLPYNSCTSYAMVDLLEGLAAQAGEMGAFNLLAELDETSPAFENMRRAGFMVFGWQRIWKLPFQSDAYAENGSIWQDAAPQDDIPIQNLFHSLVPPLAQGIDPFPQRRSQGLVYRQDGEVMAYIECHAGPRGIYLHPLIHPGVDDVLGLLKSIAPHLAPLLLRPVYLAARFYQAWLEPSLEQLGAEVAPREALLVKRLATAQRVTVPNSLQVVRERRRAEPTALLVNKDTPKLTSLQMPEEPRIVNN